MPSSINVFTCAVAALLYWSLIGLSITSLIMPRRLASWAAPTVGWAVHSVVALTLFHGIVLTKTTVWIFFIVTSVAGACSICFRTPKLSARFLFSFPSALLVAGTALLALSTALAVLPHASGDGVVLAMPIFDHSKAAFVDEIVRSGVPAVNPVFGQAGSDTRLPYYYLWHFSAAELALLGGFSGWEADAAMTVFTAFSSLSMMIGLAFWFSRSALAGWGVLAFAATASIRPLLVPFEDRYETYDWTGLSSGFGAWLFQVNWAPQHVAAAGCVLIASFLLSRLPKAGVVHAVLLALIVSAAFESSAWVGGVTFVLIAAVVSFRTLTSCAPNERGHFVVLLALAATTTIAIAAPFLWEQARALSARSGSIPVSIVPYEVLGDAISKSYRRFLDIPAFWLVYLSIELQAIYLIGVPMLVRLVSDRSLSAGRRNAAWTIFWVTAVSLVVASLLRSTLAENNDLSWRGVLPAVMGLIVSAAAGLGRYAGRMRRWQAASSVVLVCLGMICGARMMYGNINLDRNPSGAVFVRSVEMWAAVRRQSSPTERVANNPMFVADMTTWPVNISWALLSDRRSCYAGRDLALPFVPLSRRRLSEIDSLFIRVFEGRPDAGDIVEMSTTFDCSVVVLTSEDGAWDRDPFADGKVYMLADSVNGRWRIYRRVRR